METEERLTTEVMALQNESPIETMTEEQKIEFLLSLEDFVGEERSFIVEKSKYFDKVADIFQWLYIDEGDTTNDLWLIDHLCSLKAEDLLAHGNDAKRCVVDGHQNTYRMPDGSYVYVDVD